MLNQSTIDYNQVKKNAITRTVIQMKFFITNPNILKNTYQGPNAFA